ncbi:hypothetical protein NHH03_01495 [Stieleria sp. TO1_6]|nr:hypothetical protein [Stieleria tagensis]
MFDRLKIALAELRYQIAFIGIVFSLMGFCVWQVVSTNPMEQALLPGLAALGGFICAVAPDEVSDWTGFYGWTTQQYRNYPADFLRGFGTLVLVASAIYLWQT